jgi:hypothetical protein
LRKALALSLLAHLFLAWLAVREYRPTPGRRTPPHRLKIALEAPRARGAGQGKAAARPRRELRLGLAPSVGRGAERGGGPSGARGADGYDVATGMDLPTETRLQHFFRALWERIDAAVEYPDELVKRRIAGEVKLQLEVDRRGVFTGRVIGAEGQPYLAAYAAAAAIHALEEPLLPNRRGDRESMILVIRLEFRLFGRYEGARKRERGNFKNVLVFRREAYVDPELNERIERFLRKEFLPLIPLKGVGVYLDFFRVYEMIRDAGKVEERDLRRDRLELRREQWRKVIRREGRLGAPGR